MAEKDKEKYSIDIEDIKEADLEEDEMKALALAYARYLKEHDLKPGEAVMPKPEKKPEEKKQTVILTEKKPAGSDDIVGKKIREDRKKAVKRKKREQKKQKARAKGRKTAQKVLGNNKGVRPLASLLELHDRLQDRSDETMEKIGRDFAKGLHSITSTYRSSKRSIGMGLLIVGLFAAVVLIIFDSFTVYEYAYNGKILGYVKEQEEVTDVLGVAGKELSKNSRIESGVEFVANQNVTFNLVDGRGKSTDDADTAVNKFIYLTDIETEAFGVYDGDKVVAIVKDRESAEELLNQTMTELSTPDSGMELVSAEFTNTLDIQPINVLLSSVQSNQKALEQMTGGGEMETYHIVEEGETLEGLAEDFGVDTAEIYDEDNSEAVGEIEQGDKVCIHSLVEPVSVEMVEKGRMKEVIEYETIKKKSDEYYEGDTFVQQEGENRVQIFEGTLIKVAGEVTERKEDKIDVIKKGQDKIILVGTKERPKTAPTGTYALPLTNIIVTSEWGGRWGRMHDGMDFGASTGTPIYASDGGTVTRATYYSGYGLCVDIDHENGRMTRYGHCSRLLVSAGDRVYQGQEIALVGNTGHSFGSHLHFEIRINGASQNPRNYLNL